MLAQILQPAPLDSWISPPLWWENFVPACVPMFLFLSGYFGLGRAMRDNDWSKSISNFWKNIWYWIRWVLLFSILVVLAPGLWPTERPFAGKSLGDSLLHLLRSLITPQNGTITDNIGPAFFFVGFAWVAFFAALFRPFFATASMKTIRIMTAVIVGYATLVPFMNFFSTDVLAADPKSMLGAFLAVSPLTTLHFTWFNFWLAMYVRGGWFARDVQVQRVLRDMGWWLVIVIALAGFALEAVLGHEYGLVYWATTGHMPGVMYETGGYLPMMIPYVIISFKLNDVIKPESRLGRFVLRVSPTTLGTILVGWCFGTLLVRGVFAGAFTSLWEPLYPIGGSPIPFSLVWFVICTLWFALITVVVLLMAKIPFVRSLVTFTDMRPRPKRKVLA